jgi:hypothetical protein
MRRSGYSTAPSVAARLIYSAFVSNTIFNTSVASPSVAARRHAFRLMPSRLSGALAVLSALACLSGPAAFAQESGNAAANTGASLAALALSQSILGGSRRVSEQPADALSGNAEATVPADTAPAGAATPAGMTPDQIDAALGYVPDPAVSAQIREHEIDAGAAQDPAWRPVLEKAFADDAALQQFQALLAARGYSSHNLADAIAGLMWTSWQFVNDAALTDTQIRGIHQQIRTIFLASPNLPSLTGETRQRLSENAAYRVAIATAAMRADDPTLLAKSRRNIAMIVRNIVDLDLAKLDVMPDGGFSARETATP